MFYLLLVFMFVILVAALNIGVGYKLAALMGRGPSRWRKESEFALAESDESETSDTPNGDEIEASSETHSDEETNASEEAAETSNDASPSEEAAASDEGEDSSDENVAMPESKEEASEIAEPAATA